MYYVWRSNSYRLLSSFLQLKRTIKDCIWSLENQTTDKDFEIIVIDSSTEMILQNLLKKDFLELIYTNSKRENILKAPETLVFLLQKGR